MPITQISAIFFQVSDHINNTCPLTEVPCPYNWLGCFLKVSVVFNLRRDFPIQHEESVLHHSKRNCFLSYPDHYLDHCLLPTFSRMLFISLH